MHGGKSTGPKTPEGTALVAASKLKHGRRTKAYQEMEKAANARVRELERVGRELGMFGPSGQR
jgi:hypothetical protein